MSVENFKPDTSFSASPKEYLGIIRPEFFNPLKDAASDLNRQLGYDGLVSVITMSNQSPEGVIKTAQRIADYQLSTRISNPSELSEQAKAERRLVEKIWVVGYVPVRILTWGNARTGLLWSKMVEEWNGNGQGIN